MNKLTKFSMNIDKVPLLGRLNRALNMMMINIILLAVICLVLGLVIPFFPKVLDILVSASLIVAFVLLASIAYHIHQYKQKYMKFFKD